MTIRICTDDDAAQIFEIIQDSAQAYKGIIPADQWHEPYMPMEQLRREIADGVRFWAFEDGGEIAGVMGLQHRGDVDLIRHAYVRSNRRNAGIGAALLKHLEQNTTKPILIGTWAAATWAIRFYEKNGYRLLSAEETARLLKRFWKISDEQARVSVVLADDRWTK